MRRTLYISKQAAAEIRASCRDMDAEDGGAVFGRPECGDVVIQIRTPRHTGRSPSVIRMRGTDFETSARKLIEAEPEMNWLGFWHLHFGVSELSDGDRRELARLHDCGRCPPCGIVMILAIKNGVEFIRLRGWISTSRDDLVPVDLLEADDPVDTRQHPTTDLVAPPLRSPALSLKAGSLRLADELAALDSQGVRVASHRVSPIGVELVFAHDAHEGELRCTLPAECWERPPKVELQCRGQSRLVLSPLGSMLASWSSAFTLADLIAHARMRGVWPRTSKSISTSQLTKEMP